MKPIASWTIASLLLALLAAGCAGDRYNTQRGAAIGAALGAGYGQAIGRDTEGTLLGTALGGLAGAVIGNYEDQRYEAQRRQAGPAYAAPAPPAYSPPRAYAPPASGHGGNWVTVPGQSVGGYYVPPHPVWVPQQRRGVVVER